MSQSTMEAHQCSSAEALDVRSNVMDEHLLESHPENPAADALGSVHSEFTSLSLNAGELDDDKACRPTSSLEGVPAEIFIMIANNLDNVGLKALELTCKQFSYDVQLLHPEPLSILEQSAWFHLMTHEAHSRDASKPPIGSEPILSSPECAQCSVCHCCHNIGLGVFTPAQLRQPPHERACKGTTGELRLCQHLSFTYAGLQRALGNIEARPDPYNLGITYKCFECTDPSHEPSGGGLETHAPLLVETANEWKCAEPKTLRWCETVLSVPLPQESLSMPPESRIKRALLTTALSRLRGTICPHIRFDNPHVMRSACHCCQYVRDGSTWPDEFLSGHMPCGSALACGSCHTDFRLCYDVDIDGEGTGNGAQRMQYYKIWINRKLASHFWAPLGPTDSGWIAQLCHRNDDEEGHARIVEVEK